MELIGHSENAAKLKLFGVVIEMLIDTHVHFDDASFDVDRDAAYQRACAVQIIMQIVPAIHAEQWATMRDICQAYPHLYPAYGLHPMYLQRHQTAHLHQLEQWLERENPVAVGECGLDFYVKTLDIKQQIQFFTAQLAIAKDFKLPVIIHARRSVDEVIKYIRRAGAMQGVIHSFAGSEQQAKQLIDLGFYLGFGGPITYDRAKRLQRLIQTLPLDALLLETDSPDQPLSTHRGERNEPAYLVEVLQKMANLRQQSVDTIAEATTQNAKRLFKIG
jgi:TatD DNase family protein